MRSIPHSTITSVALRHAVIVCGIVALVASSAPLPAGALFHFAHVNEIMSGADGNDAIQYVEIRTDLTSQNQIGGSTLTVFQGTGHTVIGTIAGNLPGTIQNRWIMASPSAAEFLAASGIAADRIFTGTLPKSNAMVCWGKPTIPADSLDINYADCLAYGGYSGTAPIPPGSGTATTLNAGDGQMSLTRYQDLDNNSLDFRLECPDPENWATNMGSFGPCGGTDSEPDGLDDAWEALYPACVTVGVSDGSADVDTPDPDGLTNFQEMNGGSDPCDTNTDNDGCSDGEERGLVPALGGRRNPKLDGKGQYDFYDVNNSKKIDAADIGLVRSQFNQIFPAYDRSPGVAPWAPGPPNGNAISATEIGLVRASFNYTCVAAP